MKVTCITDACSYIYLHQFQVKSITLYDFLKKVATIRYSPEVRREIVKHSPNDPLLNLLRHNCTYSVSKKTPEFYDNTLFNGSLSTSGKDKGENENFIVLIDSFLSGNRDLIFLSDDHKAIGTNGHLRELLNSFPICRIWSSFEVVLYLYLTLNKKDFTYDIAESAIRDINSFIFKPRQKQLFDQKSKFSADEFSRKANELSQEATKQLLVALKKLDIIKSIMGN